MHVTYPRSHSCDLSRARHQPVRSGPSSLPACTLEFLLPIEKKLPQGDPWTQVSQYSHSGSFCGLHRGAPTWRAHDSNPCDALPERLDFTGFRQKIIKHFGCVTILEVHFHKEHSLPDKVVCHINVLGPDHGP
eukprot:scaffold121_cov356-Pavlova_lutheri.AAC.35